MLEMYWTIAACIFCGVVLFWYLLTFNLLLRLRNAVDQAWSNIEVELQRRFELIQNLVATAKGYAKHEIDTFRSVAELRQQPRPFSDATTTNLTKNELSSAIRNVMLLAESYPQLRADENFLRLQSQLTETEDRIASRRHAYNQNVNLYSNRCQIIPSSLVASLHRFPSKAFFDAPDELAVGPPPLKMTE